MADLLRADLAEAALADSALARPAEPAVAGPSAGFQEAVNRAGADLTQAPPAPTTPTQIHPVRARPNLRRAAKASLVAPTMVDSHSAFPHYSHYK